MQMKLPHVLALLVLCVVAASAHAAELRLHALLDGASVVSATDSKATGEAKAVLRDDNKLRINLVFGGLASNVTGAELHTGASSENGPAVAPLGVRENQTVGSLVDTELTLTDDVAASVRAGNAYILVTTVDHPSGAIRGQLVPQPVRLPDRP
ncbi:MAG TPA: CHRD domain-containing protein [Luteimonas sp.]|jgi:CHRD domain.